LQVARVQGGEGLIAELVQVEREGGQITPDEMVSMVFLLLAAGSETTTHLISGSVYELLRNPGLRDWLEQDRSRVGLAVEEFLRFVSPVQFSKPRYVRRDIELAGVPLKKGDRVMVMLAAANMDPAVHDQPERPDLTRKPWAARLTEEFRSGACHAGRFEGSIVLAERPDLVREPVQKALAPNPASLSTAIRAGARTFAEAGGPRAYFGAPAEATAEEGRATIETLGQILADAVREALAAKGAA